MTDQERLEHLRLLKKKCYNPQAAENIRNRGESKPYPIFDAWKYKEFITNHPIFSKLHLLREEE